MERIPGFGFRSDYYSTGPVTVPYTWVGSNGVLVDQTDPNTTTMVLPANHPDNPFNAASPYYAAAAAFYGANFKNYVGQPALLYAVLTDFPSQQIRYNTDVLRFYNRAKDDALYPEDSYVMKNVREFFAVTASLYLWGNVDRPPHNRATLREKQPIYYKWLGDLFGVQKSV